MPGCKGRSVIMDRIVEDFTAKNILYPTAEIYASVIRSLKSAYPWMKDVLGGFVCQNINLVTSCVGLI